MKLPDWVLLSIAKALMPSSNSASCKSGVFIGFDAQLASNGLVVYVSREVKSCFKSLARIFTEEWPRSEPLRSRVMGHCLEACKPGCEYTS
jgi:hypothetical protein